MDKYGHNTEIYEAIQTLKCKTVINRPIVSLLCAHEFDTDAMIGKYLLAILRLFKLTYLHKLESEREEERDFDYEIRIKHQFENSTEVKQMVPF